MAPGIHEDYSEFFWPCFAGLRRLGCERPAYPVNQGIIRFPEQVFGPSIGAVAGGFTTQYTTWHRAFWVTSIFDLRGREHEDYSEFFWPCFAGLRRLGCERPAYPVNQGIIKHGQKNSE
jgi:hypothetical protein